MRGLTLETALVPYELLSQSNSVTVVLRPSVTQTSWSDVEAFGSNVRTELESRRAPACLIDLSPLTYMGSAIVALIVRIWKVVQAQGGKMVVVCPEPAVLEVIKLAGLDKIWTIAEDRESGFKKLGVRPVEPTTEPAAIGEDRIQSGKGLFVFGLLAAAALLALLAYLLSIAIQ